MGVGQLGGLTPNTWNVSRGTREPRRPKCGGPSRSALGKRLIFEKSPNKLAWIEADRGGDFDKLQYIESPVAQLVFGNIRRRFS
jgi:hypothetical protein